VIAPAFFCNKRALSSHFASLVGPSSPVCEANGRGCPKGGRGPTGSNIHLAFHHADSIAADHNGLKAGVFNGK
jgi:hypothetical protein